jgi:hypothetical protein
MIVDWTVVVTHRFGKEVFGLFTKVAAERAVGSIKEMIKKRESISEDDFCDEYGIEVVQMTGFELETKHV